MNSPSIRLARIPKRKHDQKQLLDNASNGDTQQVKSENSARVRLIRIVRGKIPAASLLVFVIGLVLVPFVGEGHDRESPGSWFYNCVAKFHLENVDGAENSARQGIRIDTEHRVPKLEYVLGTILARKGDHQGAAEHLHNYLNLSPNAPDAIEVKKELEEVERLSAATPTSKK
jgi:hypothetical protein